MKHKLFVFCFFIFIFASTYAQTVTQTVSNYKTPKKKSIWDRIKETTRTLIWTDETEANFNKLVKEISELTDLIWRIGNLTTIGMEFLAFQIMWVLTLFLYAILFTLTIMYRTLFFDLREFKGRLRLQVLAGDNIIMNLALFVINKIMPMRYASDQEKLENTLINRFLNNKK